MDIGTSMRMARVKRAMTRAELAVKIGKHRQTVANMEARQSCDNAMIELMCSVDVFDMKVSEFVALSEG